MSQTQETSMLIQQTAESTATFTRLKAAHTPQTLVKNQLEF